VFLRRMRLKLTLAYDGRPWKGWQTQPGGVTVQDELETALLKLTGAHVDVYGSGRTDAGVHARAQVAHVDLAEDTSLRGDVFVRAMNVNLPPSIRMLNCEDAAPDFNARFDATGKVYEYRIWRGDVMSPFERGLAWHVFGALDHDALREGLALLHGTHNFARLSAARGDILEVVRRENAEGLTRTMHRAEMFEEGEPAARGARTRAAGLVPETGGGTGRRKKQPQRSGGRALSGAGALLTPDDFVCVWHGWFILVACLSFPLSSASSQAF
jgi:tRNA pseudouridine38-40 synthase